jgi:putative copper resistance protein D
VPSITLLHLATGPLLVGELSPSVTLHQLLYGFQTDTLGLVADAVTGLMVVAYLFGRARLQRKGRPWSGARTACFVAGAVSVLIATTSGVASYDDSNFVMHVIQHLILMNVAPVLLALGAPVTLALQASGRTTQTRILRVLHSGVVTVITHPVVAAGGAYATMLVYFLTPLYAMSLRHPLLHQYFHLQFLVVGCLYWWPVVGLDPVRWKLSYPMRLGYLATGAPVNAMLGVALTLNRASVDPAAHTLADTHRGGALLWGVSELLVLAGLAVMYVQWYRQDAREASRFDRRLDRELAKDPERGLAGGMVMNPRTGLWHVAAGVPAAPRGGEGPPAP